ncbi:hypothetical protein [Robertmurraya massiliosenegalensis]|uniref:hypothetical protein n=1 Tax=Robertmurraya massiliosenegalensis TaxID=1287657 RepID=UPI0002DB3452|nr:hypothetical protein [Robertmurraya massiliosenegalensis]
MKKFEELGYTVHGEVEHEGKVIRLTQNAYLDGTHENPYYSANGIDAEGNEYEITWDVVENWKELEDESECCDWDEPKSVEQID